MKDAALRIRVVLAHMTPMLQDIIRETVMHEPDVDLVATVAVGEPCLPLLQTLRADVVIFGTGAPDELTLARDAWGTCPRIKVLTIADGGRSAVLHALHPQRIVLGDVSLQSLLAAIRGAPAW